MDRRLEIILERLGNLDPEERIAALRDLAASGSPMALEILGETVDDKEPLVRFEALALLVSASGEEATEVVMSFLEDPDHGVREKAVEILRNLGDRKSEALVARLRQSGRLAQRLLAVRICGEGSDPSSVDFLISALTDVFSEVRAAAREALARINDPACKRKLVDFVLEEIESSDRVATLLRFCDLRDSEATGPITACLMDRSWRIRLSAAQAIGEIGDQSCLEALAPIARDENAAVRYYAKKAIARIRSGHPAAALPSSHVHFRAAESPPHAADPVLPAPSIPPYCPEQTVERIAPSREVRAVPAAPAASIVATVLPTPVPGNPAAFKPSVPAAEPVRRSPVASSATIATPAPALSASVETAPFEQAAEPYLRAPEPADPPSVASVDPLDVVRKALGSTEIDARLKALSEISDPGTVKELFTVISGLVRLDSSEIIRAVAVKRIAAAGAAAAMPVAREALSDPDFRVRANAIETIEALGGAEAISVLSDLLEDRDNRIRTNSAKALHNLGDRGVMRKLLAGLHSDEVWSRDSTAYTLCEIGDGSITRDVVDALIRETERDVKFKLLKCLGKFGDEGSILAVLRLEIDDDLELEGEKERVTSILSKKYPKDFSQAENLFELSRERNEAESRREQKAKLIGLEEFDLGSELDFGNGMLLDITPGEGEPSLEEEIQLPGLDFIEDSLQLTSDQSELETIEIIPESFDFGDGNLSIESGNLIDGRDDPVFGEVSLDFGAESLNLDTSGLDFNEEINLDQLSMELESSPDSGADGLISSGSDGLELNHMVDELFADDLETDVLGLGLNVKPASMTSTALKTGADPDLDDLQKLLDESL